MVRSDKRQKPLDPKRSLEWLEEHAVFKLRNRAMAWRMRDIRLDMGISLEEAAWRLGTSKSNLHDIEWGRTEVTQITIEAIRSFYGRRWNYLLTETEHEQSDFKSKDQAMRNERKHHGEINRWLKAHSKPRPLLKNLTKEGESYVNSTKKKRS